MIRPVLVSLLALSCSAIAQVKTFQIGALREDVFKVFGAPELFYAPQPGKYLHGPAEYKAAAGVWAIDDVFMRKTATNAYEVRVQYMLDGRESRLHPQQRVTELVVVVDKPGPYREMLADFPEAKDVCASGCKLFGDTMGDEYYILAYPANPTREQLGTGLLVATGFKPEGPHEGYCMALFLKLEERGSVMSPRPPDWTNGKIGEIVLEVFDFPLEKNAMFSKLLSPTVELGMWRPEK
jgi:hypothetical protein